MTQLTLDLDASTWTRVKLGAVVNRLTNGYVGPTRGLYQERGVPYLLARHVKSNRLTFDGKTFVTHEFNQKNKKSILKTGDVLLVQSGHIGESAVVTPEHEGHNCHAMIVISPKEDKLDGKFLSWYFSSHTGRSAFRRIQTGITIEHLNCRDVKEIEIPLPPLEEQRRIAAILDKADAVRHKRQEVIALTEELLRSAFLEMFGDPVTNPKGWDVIPLGDISKVKGGLQVTSKRKDHPLEVPYLRVANVYRDQLVLDEIKLIRVTPEELERTALRTGDLLIVEGHGNSQEIGRSSVWDGSIPNCTHQNHLIRVTLDSKRAEPTYISAFLNSSGGRRQLIQFGKTTSGLNTISTSNVKATKVLLPPLSEQKKYAQLKQKTAASLSCHQRYFQDTNALFNSLLQRAFRGEL